MPPSTCGGRRARDEGNAGRMLRAKPAANASENRGSQTQNAAGGRVRLTTMSLDHGPPPGVGCGPGSRRHPGLSLMPAIGANADVATSSAVSSEPLDGRHTDPRLPWERRTPAKAHAGGQGPFCIGAPMYSLEQCLSKGMPEPSWPSEELFYSHRT